MKILLMKPFMFVFYILIGFCAQLIDGTLGMAYGVSCRTLLKTTARLPSAIASAVVHCSEIPTTLASGISHWKMRNVSWKLCIKLLIPGVIGGVIGAWFLSGFGDAIEPFIDVYLIVMGIIIFIKMFQKNIKIKNETSCAIYPLGFLGGFLDAAGGGGWGPVVTSTMIASGHDAKKTIGSVNTAEFIVTVAETTAFLVLIQNFLENWLIIIALIIGGVCAAPLAAWICKKIPTRPLLGIVGILIIGLNIYNLINWFLSIV